MGTEMLRAPESFSDAALGGARTVLVQAELRRNWKRKLKRLPPAKREQFLKSQAGRSALGAKACHDLLKEIAARVDAVAGRTAGAAWTDAYALEGVVLPGQRTLRKKIAPLQRAAIGGLREGHVRSKGHRRHKRAAVSDTHVGCKEAIAEVREAEQRSASRRDEGPPRRSPSRPHLGSQAGAANRSTLPSVQSAWALVRCSFEVSCVRESTAIAATQARECVSERTCAG